MSGPVPAAAEPLANRIAELLEGVPLDVSATALTLNLACVIAGYGHRGRDAAEQQINRLLRVRVQQLIDAGAEEAPRLN